MIESKTIVGKRLAAGALALVVGGVVAVLGVVGWLLWMGRAMDGASRVRELPVYPGAGAVVAKDESTRGELVGVLTFEASAQAEDVYAFYDRELTDHGWQSVGRPSDGGGSGYMRRDGSFEGVEFTSEEFPWFRIRTNRSPVWLEIDAVEVGGRGMGKIGVSIRLMEP